MSDEKLFFKGQNPGEEVLGFCRPHWIAVLPHVIFFGLSLIFYVFLHIYFILSAEFLREWALSLHTILTFLFICHLHYSFSKIVAYFKVMYVFTNGRFVRIIEDNLHCVDVLTVQETQKNQDNFFKKFFNFGEIIFLNVEVVSLIPNPSYFFDLLNKTRHSNQSEVEKAKEELTQIQQQCLENQTDPPTDQPEENQEPEQKAKEAEVFATSEGTIVTTDVEQVKDT